MILIGNLISSEMRKLKRLQNTIHQYISNLFSALEHNPGKMIKLLPRITDTPNPKPFSHYIDLFDRSALQIVRSQNTSASDIIVNQHSIIGTYTFSRFCYRRLLVNPDNIICYRIVTSYQQNITVLMII